jgi:hypothetical protein
MMATALDGVGAGARWTVRPREVQPMRRILGSTSLRTAVIAAVMAALVAFPIGVFASHQFTDVPNSNTFHGDIDHVYDARITNGCTPTTYCPDDNVSRGQMAAFLERAGGRATSGTNGFTTVAGAPATLATVTIRAGNVTGGTAFIQLQASGYAFTGVVDATGCNTGCQVSEQIFKGASVVSNYGAAFLQNTSATAQEIGSLATAAVVAIPTGVNTTFTLQATRDTGTGAITGVGTLTATYFPFGGTGANTLASEAGEPVVLTPDVLGKP